MSLPVLLRRVALAFLLCFAYLPMSHGITPAVIAQRCNIVHAYEGLCGNSRPNACLSKEGVDYWHNMSHQTTWDAYYNLCVNVSPGKDRYSHECIAFLGINSSCTSTVEPLVEYHAVYQAQTSTYTIREEPQYVVAQNVEYNVSYTICSFTNDQKNKIEIYTAACGEALPSTCRDASTAAINDFTAICGEKTPCACKAEKGCASNCPTPVEPGTLEPAPAAPGPLTPLSPGSPPLAPGTDSGGGSDASGTSPSDSDAAIAFGAIENKAPGSPGDLGSGTAATGAKGCSLSENSAAPAHPLTLILSSLVFGAFALRIRRRPE